MAGLCAAARGRELGLEVVVYEKGGRAGGSMLLSSCVVWRYRDLATFREQCPGGDEELQREVDRAARRGSRVAARNGRGGRVGGNGQSADRRPALRSALAHGRARARSRRDQARRGRARRRRTSAPCDRRLSGRPQLVREHIHPGGDLLVRANPWSAGDGLRLARTRGAALSSGMDEFYGRAMPAPPAAVPEERFVSLAQLYGRHALVLDDRGEEFAPDPVSWSEIDLVQAIAERPNASAWYLLDEEALHVEIRGRRVGEMVEAAREAGERCCCRTSSASRCPRRIAMPCTWSPVSRTPSAACGSTGRRAFSVRTAHDRGLYRGRRRRRRDRNRRVCERPRLGARLRTHRSRDCGTGVSTSRSRSSLARSGLRSVVPCLASRSPRASARAALAVARSISDVDGRGWIAQPLADALSGAPHRVAKCRSHQECDGSSPLLRCETDGASEQEQWREQPTELSRGDRHSEGDREPEDG